MRIPNLEDFYPVVSLTPTNRELVYYKYADEFIEIRLFPCHKGYDVALYSATGILLYPSVCTNLEGVWHSLLAYKSARQIYSQFLEQYDQDRQNGRLGEGDRA